MNEKKKKGEIGTKWHTSVCADDVKSMNKNTSTITIQQVHFKTLLQRVVLKYT
jgi:hypothetical protein